jgi:NAD(P)H-dependent FMN reductase
VVASVRDGYKKTAVAVATAVFCYHIPMKNITIVLGTARIGRASERVALALLKSFENTSVNITYVDVKDHVQTAVTTPEWGEGGADTVSTKWQQIVLATDSFLFILPEYNHGYPGEWKLLIDSLGKAYKGKKAYIVGVSGGSFSGVRVADHVLPVLQTLGLTPMKQGLYVGEVTKVLDDTGVSTDSPFSERLNTFVDTVIQDT